MKNYEFRHRNGKFVALVNNDEEGWNFIKLLRKNLNRRVFKLYLAGRGSRKDCPRSWWGGWKTYTFESYTKAPLIAVYIMEKERKECYV